MRLSSKTKRWLAISGCTLAVGLTVVWFLRWRILEDLVRAELKRVAADLFDADVEVGTVRGNLLTSIQAEKVVLKPRTGSVFHEFTIKHLEVGYGLFGTGTLDVRIDGARFAFARSKSAKKADAEEILQTARDISEFRFPGRLQASDSVLAIPDGPELRIERGEINYGTWRVTLAPLVIRLSGEAALRFARLEAELEPGRLSLLENWDGGLIAAATWNRDESLLEIHWGRGDGDYLAFKGRVEPTLDAILSAKLRRLDAPFLRQLISGLPLEGEVDVEAALGGTPEEPTIDGQIVLLGLKIGDERIDKLEFPVKAEPGALVLPRTTHETPVGPVTLEARVPFPWVKREAVVVAKPPPPKPKTPDPTPDAPTPVDPVPPPKIDPPPDVPTVKLEVPSVEGFRSRLPEDIRPWIPGGRVDFTGMFSKEASKVSARFSGDRYDFPDPVGVLTNYEIEAELTTTALLIRRLRGMLGGGPIEATGSVDLTASGAPLILQLKGKDLLVVTDALARIRINPDVKITVTAGPNVEIKGDVEVPLALYYTEFGPGAPEGGRRRDPASPFGLRLLPAEGGGFRIPGIRDLERVTLDVKVVSTGECRIENSTIGALVEGDVRLKGPASSPVASGTARVTKGQVRLTSGLFLKIQAGEVYLPSDPGREPFVRFEGSVGRFDREILVVITGPMARPTLRLQSNPPRSQEELIAMIAFGRTPGSLEGGDALGALTGKVVQIYADSWPDAEAQEGFLDRLAIDVVGNTVERPVPPWELPTRGTARGTMVRTEYLLNEWLSIVGESDREANISGDLKLRLRFK